MRVLLVCRDLKRRRTLLTATRGAADDVDTVDALHEALDLSPYQAIVIDDNASPRQPPPASLLRARDGRRPPVVVLINAMHDAELLPWLENLEAVHVLQYDSVQRFSDLHVTLRKITSGDIFGIEKYFAWGARERAFLLRRSDEKGRLIEAVEEFAGQLCVQARMRALAVTVIDEFLSNAFYNAPVDAGGAFRFRDLNRTEPVALRGDEAIVVRFCADGRRLGVSVTDPFGSLEPVNVRSTLLRGLRRGAQMWDRSNGGAGLGFYCAFEALSHLVVNIEPGHRTELIGILSLRDTYRDFLQSGKSFDVFESDAPPAMPGPEVEA